MSQVVQYQLQSYTHTSPSPLSGQRKMETLNKDKGGGEGGSSNTVRVSFFFFKILVPKMKTDVPFQ